jgi:ABC-type Mn2+/Zn2+ transport system ATPase subunit
VYGQAGAGKTTLVKTLPNVIVLSAENFAEWQLGDSQPRRFSLQGPQ